MESNQNKAQDIPLNNTNKVNKKNKGAIQHFIKSSKYFKTIVMCYMIILTSIIIKTTIRTVNTWSWEYELLSISILTVVCFTILLFSLFTMENSAFFNRNNNFRWLAMMIIYTFVIVLYIVQPLLPEIFLMMSLAPMIMTIFFGEKIGIITNLTYASGYILMTDKGGEIETLLAYILIGTIACLIIKYIKDLRYIIFPIIIFFITNSLVNIFISYKLTEQIDYSIITQNIFGLIIELIIGIALKLSVDRFIYNSLDDSRLRAVTNEKFAPISELKSISISIYYHSCEVAELAAAGAKAVKADAKLTYAGGLYHEIGRIRKGDYIANGIAICKDNKVPVQIAHIIAEHTGKHRIPHTIEAAIVLLADTTISTIDYFRKDNKELDESKIIDNIMTVRLTSGILDESGITAKQFNTLINVFKNQYSKN